MHRWKRMTKTSAFTACVFRERLRMIVPAVLLVSAVPGGAIGQAASTPRRLPGPPGPSHTSLGAKSRVIAPDAEASYRALLTSLKSVNTMTAQELSELATKVDATISLIEAAGLTTAREAVRDRTTGQMVAGSPVLQPYYEGLRQFRESLGPVLELGLSGPELTGSRLLVLSIELSENELTRQLPPPAWNGTVYPVLKTSCVLAVPYPKSWDDEWVHHITDACPLIPFYGNRITLPGGTVIERARRDFQAHPGEYADEGSRLLSALLAHGRADKVGTELVVVRPPEWSDQGMVPPRRWTDADSTTPAFPFDLKYVEPITPWPDTRRMGPSARDELRQTYVSVALRDYRPVTLRNCATILKVMVVDAGTALVKEQAVAADKARLEREMEEEAQAARDAEAEQQQRLLERRKRDPKFMSPVLSSRLCRFQKIRTTAMKEIQTERDYGRNVGGVVDLAKLHRLQDVVRQSDELIRKTRRRIQSIKGAGELPCSSPMVIRLSRCLGYSAASEANGSDACEDEKLAPYIDVANAEEEAPL